MIALILPCRKGADGQVTKAIRTCSADNRANVRKDQRMIGIRVASVDPIDQTRAKKNHVEIK
jgi:hypothetical protein